MIEIIINETGEKVLINENKFSSYGNDSLKFLNLNDNLYYRIKDNHYSLLVKNMYKIEVKK